ncbi:heavy metal transporter [Mycobacterium colombiense]|jgi:copper chaperone CopZ|uniref:Heavy metal transporter n=2 Tax=Mycobacteriaceae TaxID=1762 RepID=A0A1X2KX24_9MYCO|nr:MULTISPECIES: heavy metal-associated domain-containing protein [Mycobacteriaceae]OBB78214.1 heavy metal transporter [Mycobacterium colombiense]OMB97941.1 heavy metal transporter [Mycobacterium colombiense]OMC14839.1 heavy metal transporter [Mycobacterium colombiense]OMC27436.1 heavy metal transporter [Mycobacterium colombiense]OMC30733.1 heavy metal transporter [Mycobacterium colombiense]
MPTSEYQVSGMSCGHCEAAVRSEVAQIPGIDDVTVSAATGKLVVTSAQPIDADAVLGAVDEAGYEAVLVA